MHPNPSFRKAERQHNIDFARQRGFGTLCLNADPAPLLAHIPFQLSGDGNRVEAHLVKSNPIWRALAQDTPAVIAVSGADGYVSPDWYGIDDQVPTWNYVAVHLRGRLRRLPQEDLRGVLERLSAVMEDRLAPKRPWTLDKMTPDALDRMTRMIAPVEMIVDQIDGTWKLGQNKDDAARQAAAQQISQGVGHELQELARLMDKPPA